MKKVYLLLLVFLIFSCKTTPKKDKADGDPGLSQLELTKENPQAGATPGFSDEPSVLEPPLDRTSADVKSADEPYATGPFSDVSSADDDALTQDGIADASTIAENAETKTDDLKADAQNKEQKAAAETVEQKKETPEEKSALAKEEKPPAPPARPVQPPPPVPAKQEPPAAEKPAEEKPADEKKETPSESETPPPPRYQPWITPPPAVTAVKDDVPVPTRQTLVPPKEDNVFSRIVRATVGQLIDIPFRGTNWSYLEDMVSRRGIAYMSRRNDAEGLVFTFRAEDTGTYALRFYRRDYIRDYILYDYVQVIVDEQPDKGGAGLANPSIDRGKVTAEPRWPSALEEAEMLRGGARPSSGAESSPVNKEPSVPAQRTPPASQTVTPQVPSATTTPATPPTTTPPVTTPATTPTPTTPTMPPTVTTPTTPPTTTPTTPTTPTATTPTATTPTPVTTATTPPAEKKEKLPPEEILKKAQDAFNGGNAADAIALLDQYTEYYPGGNDELYWMYGQFYEANTPSRNILLSLDYYRRLVNEYPQSRRYNDARRRISYLERFYINIQ
jgi:hypothetical protein